MVLAIVLSVLHIAYPVIGSARTMAPPSPCSRYFSYCSNWPIATWLPALERAHHTRAVSFLGGFVYEGRMPHPGSFAETQGAPMDGTPFVYGNAGPPKGTALYDPTHCIAFYGQGCCAWHEAVLAAGALAPPRAVRPARLDRLRTAHGLHLGMSLAAVMRIYGTERPRPSSVRDVSMIAYRHIIKNTCEQDDTFGFYRGALIYIEFGDAC